MNWNDWIFVKALGMSIGAKQQLYRHSRISSLWVIVNLNLQCETFLQGTPFSFKLL